MPISLLINDPNFTGTSQCWENTYLLWCHTTCFVSLVQFIPCWATTVSCNTFTVDNRSHIRFNSLNKQTTYYSVNFTWVCNNIIYRIKSNEISLFGTKTTSLFVFQEHQYHTWAYCRIFVHKRLTCKYGISWPMDISH